MSVEWPWWVTAHRKRSNPPTRFTSGVAFALWPWWCRDSSSNSAPSTSAALVKSWTRWTIRYRVCRHQTNLTGWISAHERTCRWCFSSDGWRMSAGNAQEATVHARGTSIIIIPLDPVNVVRWLAALKVCCDFGAERRGLRVEALCVCVCWWTGRPLWWIRLPDNSHRRRRWLLAYRFTLQSNLWVSTICR